jgi:hypothetical protein
MRKIDLRVFSRGSQRKAPLILAILITAATSLLGPLVVVQPAEAIYRTPFNGTTTFTWNDPSRIKLETKAVGAGTKADFVDPNFNDADHIYYIDWPNPNITDNYESCRGFNGDEKSTARLEVTSKDTATFIYIWQRLNESDGDCQEVRQTKKLENTGQAVTFTTPATTPTTAVWVNDAAIKIGDDTLNDSNPNDTDRTFKKGGGTYCTNGAVDTITLATPTTGTFYKVTTPKPTGADKVACTVTATPITITQPAKAGTQAKKCTASAATCAQGNSKWATICANFIGPVQTGSLCSPTGNTTKVPSYAPAAVTNGNASGNQASECDSLGDFSFRWIACPLLTATNAFIVALDNLIQTQLHYDTTIFDRTTKQGEAFYNAFSTFRSIAYIGILFGGLIMVFSQAINLQIFEAVTIRRALPKLLIAIVILTLLWPGLQLFVTFSNDVGHWLYEIIMMPFSTAASTTTSSTAANIAGVGAAIGAATLGAGAALIILTPMGIMSILGTAAIALIIGFIVIEFRVIVLSACIIVSPIAVVAKTGVIPGISKFGDFIQNGFISMIMLFWIVMFLYAMGDALALIAGNALLALLIKIITAASPIIALKLASGLMQTIFSFVNDRGRGAFDRLSKGRQNAMANSWNQMKHGARFSDRNALTRGFNRASVGASSGVKGRFGFGARGRQMYDQRKRIYGAGLAKDPAYNSVMEDDDTVQAGTYQSEAAAVKGLTDRFQQQFKSEGYSDAQAQTLASKKAKEKAAAWGTAVGYSRPAAIAAAQQLVTTGTGYSDMNDMVEGLVRASGGDKNSLGAMAGFANFMAKQKGRHDLAPGAGTLVNMAEQAMNPMTSAGTRQMQADQALEKAYRSASMYQFANQKGAATKTFAKHYTDQLNASLSDPVGNNDTLVNALTVHEEFKAMLPNTTGDNRDAVNSAIAQMEQAIANAGTLTPSNKTVIDTARAEASKLARTYERPDPNKVGP